MRRFYQSQVANLGLGQLAGYRNRLTHFYAKITAQELFLIVTGELDAIDRVADELRSAAGRLVQSARP